MSDPEDHEESEVKREGASPSPESKRTAIDTVDARVLLGGSGVLRIELDGELYTLRVTRNNRLILTK